MLLEFSALLRHKLLVYSHANRAVPKLPDQKQLDFEKPSDYLSGVTSERGWLLSLAAMLVVGLGQRHVDALIVV